MYDRLERTSSVRKRPQGFKQMHLSERGLTFQTDLSENWSKSASRSHIRRPLRAAFAEYTGPIPFFVVPRLIGRQEKTEEQDAGKEQKVHLYMTCIIVFVNYGKYLLLYFYFIVFLS